MTTQPHLCLARDFYAMTAGLAAFNIPAGVTRRGNSRSTTYVFPDGSKFVVGRSGYHRYVGLDGWTYAERASSAVARGDLYRPERCPNCGRRHYQYGCVDA